MFAVSFISGTIFGYNLKAWQVKRIIKKKSSLENELKKVKEKLLSLSH